MPGFMNPGFGRGRGFAWRARAFQPQFVPFQIQPQAITQAEEKEMLEQELKTLKQGITQIQDRLKEIDKK
jgi:hypothetical protein